ncbi:hypothetical protein SESBI_32993 [Sesbania bispinosa]|nr:hypothetical protein SESBI_32993 [Sesbania bispinosa]
MASESHNKPSGGELFASAKLVADAAQSTLKNESEKVDKVKVADAAGDLLDAAGQYGKLDDQKGIGQYVDKAADYLHQYQSNTTTAAPPSKPESQGDAAQSGGGLGGDFAKLAGGFFKK